MSMNCTKKIDIAFSCTCLKGWGKIKYELSDVSSVKIIIGWIINEC